MPRKRASNEHLPERVYRLPSGSYRYISPDGQSHLLAKRGASLSDIEEALKRVITKDEISLEYFCDIYFASRRFRGLRPATQEAYRWNSKMPIQAFKGDASMILPANIGEYMDIRGEVHRVAANHELRFLRQVFQHAVRVGLMESDPTRDIKPIAATREERKQARRRYVTDEMYQTVYALCPAWGQVAMELAYCTGCRPADVISLRWDQIDSSILIEESKTGQVYAKELSARILTALNRLERKGPYVITNSLGRRYSSVRSWRTSWRTWVKKAPEDMQFQFYDLRRKAITDHEGDKQGFSMHQSARMLGIYDLSVPESPSH